MKKIFAVVAAVLFIFSGCSKSVITALQIEAAPLIATNQNEQEHESILAAQGANEFAFALTAALLENAGNENLIISPYSVWLPLAALINAVDEDYRAELIEMIAAAGLDYTEINRAASRMLYDLTSRTDTLQIVNAIFVDNGYTLNQRFAQTYADYFRGDVMNVNFSSPEAVDTVNQWASDNTNGLINQVVESFSPETVAAIANAIYFFDEWRIPFSGYRTREDIFHSPTGDVQADFMRNIFYNIMYFEDAQMQSVTLDFAAGGGLTILLPKNGDAAGFLSGMSNEDFTRIENNSVISNVRFSLPRFSLRNSLKLEDVLSDLGMEFLFDREIAAITGLIDDDDLLCWIGQVTQAAMIEVDEDGTTAAAVTILGADGGTDSVPPQPEHEMICNTPFAFILHMPTHDGGRQVLFTGVVNRP